MDLGEYFCEMKTCFTFNQQVILNSYFIQKQSILSDLSTDQYNN